MTEFPGQRFLSEVADLFPANQDRKFTPVTYLGELTYSRARRCLLDYFLALGMREKYVEVTIDELVRELGIVRETVLRNISALEMGGIVTRPASTHEGHFTAAVKKEPFTTLRNSIESIEQAATNQGVWPWNLDRHETVLSRVFAPQSCRRLVEFAILSEIANVEPPAVSKRKLAELIGSSQSTVAQHIPTLERTQVFSRVESVHSYDRFQPAIDHPQLKVLSGAESVLAQEVEDRLSDWNPPHPC